MGQGEAGFAAEVGAERSGTGAEATPAERLAKQELGRREAGRANPRATPGIP
jgi:hypothetical protein